MLNLGNLALALQPLIFYVSKKSKHQPVPSECITRSAHTRSVGEALQFLHCFFFQRELLSSLRSLVEASSLLFDSIQSLLPSLLLTPQLNSLGPDLNAVLNPYGKTDLSQVLRLLALLLRCDTIWRRSPVLWISAQRSGVRTRPTPKSLLQSTEARHPRQYRTHLRSRVPLNISSPEHHVYATEARCDLAQERKQGLPIQRISIETSSSQ